MKRLENWSVVTLLCNTWRLHGIISGYQPYPDGTNMTTSPIYELDFENNLATTLCSNSSGA